MRFAEKRLTGIPGRPAVAPQAADRAAGSGHAARSRSTKCAEEPPFVEVAPGRYAACWKAAA